MWIGWQNWLNHLESPHGANTKQEDAINGCESNGALMDQPI
jgi:hypothetical protein